MSYISRACSSLVRQPYYAPNRFISKISGLETILATLKDRLDGRTFYMDEYTLIFLFSQCIRCAQKRDCWEWANGGYSQSQIASKLANETGLSNDLISSIMNQIDYEWRGTK